MTVIYKTANARLWSYKTVKARYKPVMAYIRQSHIRQSRPDLLAEDLVLLGEEVGLADERGLAHLHLRRTPRCLRRASRLHLFDGVRSNDL